MHTSAEKKYFFHGYNLDGFLVENVFETSEFI